MLLNFVAALSESAAENLFKLEKNIRAAIQEDPFIFEACAPLFKGGKRLRPMLFLLCANSKKFCPPEKTMPLAVALELIHTASLVHDDIIDNSKKRRGVETSNSKYVFNSSRKIITARKSRQFSPSSSKISASEKLCRISRCLKCRRSRNITPA